MGPFVRSFHMAKYNYDRYHSAGASQQFPNVCIGYILRGQAEFLYKGRVYTANENEVVYIPKGTCYYSIWNGQPDIVFYSLTIEYTDPYAQHEYGFQILPAHTLSDEFETLHRAVQSENDFGALSQLYAVLALLYPSLQTSEQHGAEKSVLPAIEHLEQHYAEKTTVAQLAQLCGFSESRFFAVFKQVTNSTPIEYKQNVAIQHALELLTQTSLTVEEISRFLGFSSPSYFRRVFRSLTGQTPKALRNKTTER